MVVWGGFYTGFKSPRATWKVGIDGFEISVLKEALVLAVFGIDDFRGPVIFSVRGIHVSHDDWDALLCCDYCKNLFFHGFPLLKC